MSYLGQSVVVSYSKIIDGWLNGRLVRLEPGRYVHPPTGAIYLLDTTTDLDTYRFERVSVPALQKPKVITFKGES
jgi:hypothetical protein